MLTGNGEGAGINGVTALTSKDITLLLFVTITAVTIPVIMTNIY